MTTNLDIAMRLRHISDPQMAEAVGVSHTAINQKRRGRARVTGGELRAFAQVLHVPPEMLDSTAGDLLRWFAREADGGEQLTFDDVPVVCAVA